MSVLKLPKTIFGPMPGIELLLRGCNQLVSFLPALPVGGGPLPTIQVDDHQRCR